MKGKRLGKLLIIEQAWLQSGFKRGRRIKRLFHRPYNSTRRQAKQSRRDSIDADGKIIFQKLMFPK